MLQKRSAFAHEGGTWSCCGRRARPGEDPLDGRAARGVGGDRSDPGRHRGAGLDRVRPGRRLVVHDLRGRGAGRVRGVDQLRDRRHRVGQPRRGRAATAARRLRRRLARRSARSSKPAKRLDQPSARCRSSQWTSGGGSGSFDQSASASRSGARLRPRSCTGRWCRRPCAACRARRTWRARRRRASICSSVASITRHQLVGGDAGQRAVRRLHLVEGVVEASEPHLRARDGRR